MTAQIPDVPLTLREEDGTYITEFFVVAAPHIGWTITFNGFCRKVVAVDLDIATGEINARLEPQS